MTDKDPKDMTASEMLRKAADGYEGGPGTVTEGLIDLMGFGFNNTHSECFEALADKIDAELAQARDLSLRQGAELWAKANGWPDFRDGEDFGAWLDRCAFAKPLDDCGEPVQIGERVVDKVRGDIDVSRISYTANGFYFNASHNACGMRIAQRITYGKDEPVERPRVLAADGLPIKEGETVYDVDTGEEHVVRLPCAGTGKTFFEGGGYRDPAYLTHTPPDTLERLRDDIAEWRAECANPGSGWDAKTAEWAARIDAIIRRTGGAE